MVWYIIGEAVFCFPTSEQTNDESERKKKEGKREKQKRNKENKCREGLFI